ncbi:MAG TPA: TonB-dependent receptor [Candidatus Nanoarchaeia archaeon]|nr:TonB-dependent receptor [Candidatus Nanoarchaeia archaeon]
MKMNRGFAPVMWLLVAILLVSAAVAQETTAGLQGTIKDPQGLVVSKATVEVSGPALIGTKKSETDASGYYRFANLPPGEYIVTVTAQGFRTHKQSGLRLEVGKLPTLDLKMEVGGIEQTVEVTGAAPIVDVTQSKVAVTVSQEVIDNIPKGRSFQSLINFAPGARMEPLQSGGGAAANATGYQIDGASDSENAYLVEGMDTTEMRGGGSGTNVPMEFIQEVQIKTSGFEAEYGGALGGVVNVVQKRGSNAWHGSAFTYYRSDLFNATGVRNTYNSGAGLRLRPTSTNSRSNPQPSEVYSPKKDHQKIVEPGFELGGYIKKDKLWWFGSYVPGFDRLRRTVNFNCNTFACPEFAGGFEGARTFNQAIDTHNAMTRVDFLATNKIRLFGSFQTAYQRGTGNNFALTALPNADSAIGGCQFRPDDPVTGKSGRFVANSPQCNSSATSDPNLFNQSIGWVMPNNNWSTGADITITPNLIATARYGSFYTNQQDRNFPQIDRYLFGFSSQGATAFDDDEPLPTQYQNNTGFQNVTEVRQYRFDKRTRNGFNADLSYFKRALGTHNFKFGYSLNRLANDVFYEAPKGYVQLYWQYDYEHDWGIVTTDSNGCYGVGGYPHNLNAMHAGWSFPTCSGRYGFYRVIDFQTKGNVSSFNHSLYMQDAWTLGRGVTINAGVRFDREELPSFRSESGLVSTPIKFGFGDKVAPRIGAAWDVFQNGKFKLYGSWGMFYDIMKYNLPRGSFGGDYWHDCNYTLDDPNYTAIHPQKDAAGHVMCPFNGADAGMTGLKIEEDDWRIPSNLTSNNRIDPDLKPMRQREMVIGADYALTPMMGLELRYSRKRLDRTIEDVGYLDPSIGEAYYIANPGEGVASNPLEASGFCAAESLRLGINAVCKPEPKAVRNYDGVEVRFTKKASEHWFASVSYTYSRLWGNYGGLTSSDETGRHDPNANRYFDLPHMGYDAYGKQSFGFLPTDRPHTLKLFGYYNLKWLGGNTIIGLSQQIYSGTPITTELAMFSSTPIQPEGRGNFANYTIDSVTGDWTRTGVKKNYRTPSFTETGFNFVHEFKLSKKNEALRAGIEANINNLLNQRNAVRYRFNSMRSGQVNDEAPAGCELDASCGALTWATFFNGFDYVAAANNSGLTLDSRYGRPDLWQAPREMRFKFKFTF